MQQGWEALALLSGNLHSQGLENSMLWGRWPWGRAGTGPAGRRLAHFPGNRPRLSIHASGCGGLSVLPSHTEDKSHPTSCKATSRWGSDAQSLLRTPQNGKGRGDAWKGHIRKDGSVLKTQARLRALKTMPDRRVLYAAPQYRLAGNLGHQQPLGRRQLSPSQIIHMCHF